MNSTTLIKDSTTLDAVFADTNVPWYARQVAHLLKDIEHGTLQLTYPNGLAMNFGHGAPVASLHFESWGGLRDILTRGDVGFAEGYIDGKWTTSDLPSLLLLLASNRNAIDQGIYGDGWWGRLIDRLRHLMNSNTLSGSRRNIARHYDLGNDFYSLWLDHSMTYSSARFDGDLSLPLVAAQQNKYRAMLNMVEPEGALSILEIGCGWGGFAEFAAERGHRVRGLTLSRAQLEYARMRLDRFGHGESCPIVLQDYRLETGQYDAIVSIEMFEAVGEKYWPTYFETIKKTLKPGGRAVIQSILIDDALFDRYRSGTDFIQQYIFPGGMLPSASRFGDEARRAGLQVTAASHFGLDYAETLLRWRKAFFARIEQVEELGFDARFQRIWAFYLAYCEAGFRAGSIDVAQFRLEHA